ncbi:OmpA family protein [Nitrosomonas sp. Is35]|uniref:OmpA family protein n=1 Tax=Nitrosomonas sp. Is35 TaxID=3080534 RepID=UPI00294B8C23|nr:OmpA family protein [Nitrosomonas sp. Is35]MDV6347288.1 OmpA family protein [Nitrosomonas sp. Is35]
MAVIPAPPVAAPTAAAETLIQSGVDPEADKAFATEMQEVITQLENKVATAEDKIAGIKAVNLDTQPRTVTVFGGKTFRSGQDVVQDVAYSAIENLVQEIAAFPNSRILIEGHTDNIPTGKSGSDNMDLSLRRAKAIANILVLNGIPKDRISVNGYGDTQPITSNNTEEGRAKNRRVEVKLLPQGGAN